MKVVKSVSLVSVLLAGFILTACNMDGGANEGNNGGMQQQQNRTMERVRGYHQQTQNGQFGANRTDKDPWDTNYTDDRVRGNERMVRHNNTRMEVSQEIADAVANMNEVRSANVLLTDRNAYVAVVMEDGGKQNMRGINRYGNDREDNGVRGTQLDYGEYTRERDVSGRIKDQIAERVREIEPEVRNVYISANPDFVDRVNGYMDQLADGEPMEGLMEEFNTMVERIFPQNR